MPLSSHVSSASLKWREDPTDLTADPRPCRTARSPDCLHPLVFLQKVIYTEVGFRKMDRLSCVRLAFCKRKFCTKKKKKIAHTHTKTLCQTSIHRLSDIRIELGIVRLHLLNLATLEEKKFTTCLFICITLVPGLHLEAVSEGFWEFSGRLCYISSGAKSRYETRTIQSLLRSRDVRTS